MIFLISLVYASKMLCSFEKQSDYFLNESSSIEEYSIRNDYYDKLSDPLKIITKWNNDLLNQINKIQIKISLAYNYTQKCHAEENIKFNKKKFKVLLDLSKKYKSIFCDDKDSWLSSETFSELEHFIRDEDSNKKFRNVKKSKKFIKKYYEVIKNLYDLCSRTMTIYKDDTFYHCPLKFNYSRVLLVEVRNLVVPGLEIIDNLAICCDIFSDITHYSKIRFFEYK